MSAKGFAAGGGAPNEAPRARRQATWGLSLLALGIVYGDIGTSPLYAARETFNPDHGIPFTQANVIGGVSAIFWSLMIVVSLKYVTLVLRADNRGEGGIMALLALATAAVRTRPQLVRALRTVGVFGAALFYGDAVLTPAISVLSAVEGLEVGTSAFKPYVVPISVGILVALFTIQRRGTGSVGLLFGPVCAMWFFALAADGIWNIAKAPVILEALEPGPRSCLHHLAWRGIVSRPRLGAARDYRRRSAVRRHGAFRQACNPASRGSVSSRRRSCSTTSDRARC